MSLDRGQYSMGTLGSRQVAQRDLHSHSRLKHRRTKLTGEENVEDRLKRMKQELEEREKSIPSQLNPQPKEADAGKRAQEFDDADAILSSSSDDEEDDEKQKGLNNKEDQALAKELERIRREKAIKEEAAKTATTKVSRASNPLLEKSAPVQRRWDDDVIFRNQAVNEPNKKEKRLVNDITHSDKHKEFMKKFIM